MIVRVYYPYWQWEDIGMWRRAWGQERERFLQHAIAFTGDADAYGAAIPGRASRRLLDTIPALS